MHRIDFMAPRISSEFVQSLRVTLKRLEENFPLPEDQPVIAELKRFLLLRIAEVESAIQDKSKSTDEPTEGIESTPVVWLRLGSS